MKEKLVNQLNGGEILADSVITGDNQVIIPKGTVLKEEYIGLMGILGINSVFVQEFHDTIEQKNKIFTEKQEKEYYQRIKAILEHYIYKDKEVLSQVKPLAIEIVDLILLNMDKDILYDMESYQGDLYKHTLHVTQLSVMLGIVVGMKKEQLCELAMGAILHDVGIRFISADYYEFDMDTKSPSEILELKKHTILGYTVLENEDWVSDIAKKIVLSHHEKMDGSGYPLKQRNQEIECKIVQICDTFDGMLCGIECKKTTTEEAFQYIKEQPNLFDDTLSDLFCKMVALHPVGTKVYVMDGKEAVVTKQTKDPKSPIVYIPEDDVTESKEVETKKIHTQVEL